MALVERTEADKEALQTTIRANKRLQANHRQAVGGAAKECGKHYSSLIPSWRRRSSAGAARRSMAVASTRDCYTLAIEAKEEQEDASSGVPKNVQQAYMDLVMREMDKEKE